jgi:hypothetical protein
VGFAGAVGELFDGVEELDAFADPVESAWGAVSGLLPVRFPRPLAEPAVRLSAQRALRGVCRGFVQSVWFQGLGIVLPR